MVCSAHAKWDEDLFGAELITHTIVRHLSRIDYPFRVEPEGTSRQSLHENQRTNI